MLTLRKVHVRPETAEEKVIYNAIVWTWVIYLVGGVYVVAPVLGWSLLVLSTRRMLGLDPKHRNRTISVPMGVSVWAYSMALMAVALIVGHMNFDLGFAATLKSFIGWMKGWALLPVFAFVGATMSIRSAVIYRATNVLAAQTLCIATPILIVLSMSGLPRVLYTSPLEIIGGPGREFFSVITCIKDPQTGVARFQFFAPWAPGAAAVASLAFVCALFEKDTRWRAVGIISALVVCILSQSRMSIIAVPSTCLMVFALSNASRPWIYVVGVTLVLALLPFADIILHAIEDAVAQFNGARAGSSRVRATLQRIAP